MYQEDCKRNHSNPFIALLYHLLCLQLYSKKIPAEKIMKTIKKFHLNPFVESIDQKSPFEHAIIKNRFDVIQLILNEEKYVYENDKEKSFQPKEMLNRKNVEGETFLHVAAQMNRRKIFNLLKQNGAEEY